MLASQWRKVQGRVFSTQPACSLPMDILDDEMVNVVLYVGSNLLNYECIAIFVITSPKVPDQKPVMQDVQTSYRASIYIPDIQEEVLPVTTLM